VRRFLATESDTLDFGAALSRGLRPGLVIHLVGDLGAGKTTLVRGLLRGLGYTARVKSPTFTLVEPYSISRLDLYHFDFYRFTDAQDLGASGFREYFRDDAICLIEWPEKAAGLPSPDLRVELRVEGTGRSIELQAHTEAGRLCLTGVEDSNTA
jgi:tRNA threonylcarbamoyladenosine biosynthesis protein TsaE